MTAFVICRTFSWLHIEGQSTHMDWFINAVSLQCSPWKLQSLESSFLSFIFLVVVLFQVSSFFNARVGHAELPIVSTYPWSNKRKIYICFFSLRFPFYIFLFYFFIWSIADRLIIILVKINDIYIMFGQLL